MLERGYLVASASSGRRQHEPTDTPVLLFSAAHDSSPLFTDFQFSVFKSERERERVRERE